MHILRRYAIDVGGRHFLNLAGNLSSQSEGYP